MGVLEGVEVGLGVCVGVGVGVRVADAVTHVDAVGEGRCEADRCGDRVRPDGGAFGDMELDCVALCERIVWLVDTEMEGRVETVSELVTEGVHADADAVAVAVAVADAEPVTVGDAELERTVSVGRAVAEAVAVADPDEPTTMRFTAPVVSSNVMR